MVTSHLDVVEPTSLKRSGQMNAKFIPNYFWNRSSSVKFKFTLDCVTENENESKTLVEDKVLSALNTELANVLDHMSTNRRSFCFHQVCPQLVSKLFELNLGVQRVR